MFSYNVKLAIKSMRRNPMKSYCNDSIHMIIFNQP